MKRKLHERDLIQIIKKYGNVPIFACTKTGDKTMSFWCPLCYREHTHGLETKPFEISSRAAHCGKDRWIRVGKFFRHEGYQKGGYWVFWDGTAR